MKSPAERGTIGAWAYEARADADLSVEEVVERLSRAGQPVSAATVRGIEGGSKKPSRRLLRALGTVYGRPLPGESGEAGGTPHLVPADLSDLNAALAAQAEGFAKMLAFALDRDRSVEARIRLLEGEVRTLRERLGVEGPQGQSTPPQIGG